ncbi:MAG: hypothetical protein NTW91_00755 [Verrucomicrobia bacterium]|nr:hypothetical protein [Verrucomicrobiota bacterium]
MCTKTKKIWFPAKRYRWGWGLGLPRCWQGWVVMVLCVLLLAGAGYLLLPRRAMGFDLVAVAPTAILIAVYWIKGEKPGWRWGKD